MSLKHPEAKWQLRKQRKSRLYGVSLFYLLCERVLVADDCKQSIMLQAQIDSRNKELQTLYQQLDRFFGLPGFALTKSRKKDTFADRDKESDGIADAEEVC